MFHVANVFCCDLMLFSYGVECKTLIKYWSGDHFTLFWGIFLTCYENFKIFLAFISLAFFLLLLFCSAVLSLHCFYALIYKMFYSRAKLNDIKISHRQGFVFRIFKKMKRRSHLGDSWGPSLHHQVHEDISHWWLMCCFTWNLNILSSEKNIHLAGSAL